MKKSNQSGFAAIEAILVCVTVGIIGFTGFFVWNAKQKTDDSLSNTANSQPALQNKKTAEVPAGKQTFLNITEWGVKLPLDAENGDVVYCYERMESGEAYVRFSATSLGGAQKSAEGTCNSGIATLSRYKIGDTAYMGIEPIVVTKDWVKDAPKVGEYYYMIEGSHAQFSDDNTLNAKAEDYKTSIFQAAKNIQGL